MEQSKIIDTLETYQATDVLVLLADTVTYHLRGVRKPWHRHWPTRPPPNKDRVNGLAPHQPTPPGR